MKFIKFEELPKSIQTIYDGQQLRFTFWVRMVKGSERYYAKDDKGTDVWAYQDSRWTCIKN